MRFLPNKNKFKLKLLSLVIAIIFVTFNLTAYSKIITDESKSIENFASGVDYFIKNYKPYKPVVQPEVSQQKNSINLGTIGYGSYNAAGGGQLLVESKNKPDMIIAVQGIIGGIDLTEDELLKLRVAATHIINNSEQILNILDKINDSNEVSYLYKYLIAKNSVASQVLRRLKKNNAGIDNLDDSQKATSIKQVTAIDTLNKNMEIFYEDLIRQLEFIFGSTNTMERLLEFLEYSNSYFVNNNNDLVKNNTTESNDTESSTNKPIYQIQYPIYDNIYYLKNYQPAPTLIYINNTSPVYCNMPDYGNNFGDNYSQGDIWLRSNYLHYKVDINNKLEFTQKSASLGFGIEYQINTDFNLGLLYNYVNSDITRKQNIKQEYDIKSHDIGAYFLLLNDNSIFVDGEFHYIKNKLDGKLDATEYKYDVRLINANAGVGIKFNLDSQWYIEPKSCIDFIYYKDNQTTLKNIHNYRNIKISAKCAFGGTILLAGYILKPRIDVGVAHELSENENELLFKFPGKNGEIIGTDINKNGVNLGLGTSIISGDFSIDIDYKLNLAKSSKAQSATFKLGYLF